MNVRGAHDAALPAVEVEIHEQLRTAIVTLRGEHDLETQPHIGEALGRAREQQRVLVDLSECAFADSSVINALIVAEAEARERNASVELVIPPDAGVVQRVAELVQLGEILLIHSSREITANPAGDDAA